MNADNFRFLLFVILLAVLILAMAGGLFGPIFPVTKRGENYGPHTHDFGYWRYNAVTIRDREGQTCLFVMAWKEDADQNTEWVGTELDCR